MLPASARTLSVLVLSVTGLSALAFASPDEVDAEVVPAAATPTAEPASPPVTTVRVGALDRIAGPTTLHDGGWLGEGDLDPSSILPAARTQPLPTVAAGGGTADEAEVRGGDDVAGGRDGVGVADVEVAGVEVASDEARRDGAGDEVAGVGVAGGDAGDEAGSDDAGDGGTSDDEVPVFVAADGDRVTAERIRAFLAGRGAPLAEHAETLVLAGVEHDVDPRLVVGIAIAESNGGKRLPAGSHNAWGWSGSGSHGLAHWASWDASIDDFTERLGRLYDTSSVDESFARTYCPPNWRWWLETVTWTKGVI